MTESRRIPSLRLILALVLVPLAAAAVVAVLAATDTIGFGESEATRSDPPAATAAGRPKTDRFDEDRAWALLRSQVAVGERPAGSPQLRALAEKLRRRLPRGRFQPIGGGMRNILGRIPGRKPAILVGAHYDTKVMEGLLGAEDGAGGTAAVVELSRALRRMRRPRGAPEIRFVLFDGEECPDDTRDFYTCGLRGSRFYAQREASELKAVIVLDFIAQKDLSIPRDASSDERLWARLRAAAKRVGTLDVFPDETQGTILDDHTPFLRAGVPAIDLIDFAFPCWHKTCDDLSAVSKTSLDKSGETVLEMLRRLQ